LNARRRVPEHAVVLSLGSNLGSREEHLLAGMSRLARIPGFKLIALSSLYESEPLGISTTHSFINAACLAACRLPARQLLAACRGIEREAGRAEASASRDRTLDIDIVLYGDTVIEERDLTIPHPRYHERLFVLMPLMEICPSISTPPSGRTIADVYRSCSGGGWVRKVSGRTAILRTA